MSSTLLETAEVLVQYIAEPGAHPPHYATQGAAGADIRAFLSEPMVIEPNGIAKVPTGISVAIPNGYEIQVRPRSGLAAKHGITVLNGPGTIDSDYRGQIFIILVNLGSERFTIEHEMRVAQLVVAPVVKARFDAYHTLDETARGSQGFGHTGFH